VAFTKDQPKDGDTILHCGHLGRSAAYRPPAHWFQFKGSAEFTRPDGTHGKAEWFAACEPCFVKHGKKVADFPRGDAIWTGDAPTIVKDEN